MGNIASFWRERVTLNLHPLMEGFAVLLGLGVFFVCFLLPIITAVRQRRLHSENDALRRKLADLEVRLDGLIGAPPSFESKRDVSAASAEPLAPIAPSTVELPERIPSLAEEVPPPGPPPLPPTSAPAPSPIPQEVLAATPRIAPPAAPRPPLIQWEQFMGVKLFAWIGGFTLFLAVAFFVKYSFEHDLIPAEIRAAIGFALSIGLIVGGLRLARTRFLVTSHALNATGIVSLYAVTFACHAVYHFALFGSYVTFGLMALITAVAFLLAVRLEARVVALLGLLGGFLTPILLATGQDNPVGLFGYVALLNLGLIAVALSRRWHFLVPLGAGGTLLMLLGWTGRFFTPEKYAVPMTVTLGFGGIYLATLALAKRRNSLSSAHQWTAAAAVLCAFGYWLFFTFESTLATRPALYLGYALAVHLLLLGAVWLDRALHWLQGVGAALGFAILGYWIYEYMSPALFSWSLGAFLGFAAFHTVVPLALSRVRPDEPASSLLKWAPAVSLLLVLAGVLKADSTSWLVWPAVLLLDLAVITVAAVTLSTGAVVSAILLTLTALGASLLRLPAYAPEPSGLLILVGGFAILFVGAGIWLSRRLESSATPSGQTASRNVPVLGALMPFVLITLVIVRLPLPTPAEVYGLALLLAVLNLGLARLLKFDWLPLAALIGVAIVQGTWIAQRLTPASLHVTWVWATGFYAVFALFPFVFRKSLGALSGPWIAAALAAPVHFAIIYFASRPHFPAPIAGLLPAAFAFTSLLSLLGVIRTHPAADAPRLARLAWFGGVALLFITLIFPIQFSRQWITVAWALEAVALLWLGGRVPHPGLHRVAVGLFALVFVRLILNPQVVTYQLRAETPLLNWYLYTYVLAAACNFFGAHLLGEQRVFGLRIRAWLQAAAVVTLFALLNIEIADYFGEAGRPLRFEFSGNFARDMTYTIAWALFALALLVAGIRRGLPLARYAAIGLMGAALLKLFFHDLDSLGQLYRVAALGIVAVIAIFASFLYQRFLPPDESKPPQP